MANRVRLASFNVENLFLRPAVMNRDSWEEGKAILTAHATINALLAKPKYTTKDKERIVELLGELGLEKDDESKWVILRRNRGKLVSRSDGLEVIAEGRGDWIGWVELKVEQVSDVAVENTARIVNAVGADILGVVEAESRPALQRFSRELLPAVGGSSYDTEMLIDGNDDRGIDVGVMLKRGCSIDFIRSHVDDQDTDGAIFSRDCPEYHIVTPSGASLVVLVNHFKSKGYGSASKSDAKRKRQASRVATICTKLLKDGQSNIAVIGDFNDTPDSDPLSPLLANTKLNFRDIWEHTRFDDGGRPGTYGNCAKSNKIDYILLSPALFNAVHKAGVDRSGIWGGKNGDLFPHIDEVTRPSEAASDHAALWVDLDLEP